MNSFSIPGSAPRSSHWPALGARSLGLVVALTPTLLGSATLWAADNPMLERIEITVPIVPRDRIEIAVPPADQALIDRNPILRRAADELHAVLRDDLAYSGVFRMVPAELYAKVGPTRPENVPYDDWVAIGASFLVLLNMVPAADGKLAVEARLFETKLDRKMILGKAYESPVDAVRAVAHTFADLVIGQLSGIPGVSRSKLLFVSDRDGQRSREVYMVDYDGHDPVRLTSTRRLNMAPEWSPDNDKVVYTSYLRGNPDLYIMPRLGGENQVLFAKPGMNSSPAWSPDGKRIAFASSSGGSDTELYLIAPDGSNLRRLTHNPGIDTNPAWSPTGNELAFTSDRSGRPQIYLMDADGLNIRRLTRQGPFNDGAAWAPRGRSTRLAFAGMTGGQFQIFVHTVESNELAQLTDSGSNESPTWSPDGRQLAYASTRGGQTDIYIMNDDGSNSRRITRGGNNLSPAWSH